MSAPKNGEDGMNYNVDVNGVIKDVFGDYKNRNDLAVQIENGTKYGFFVQFRVDHGALSSTKGDETLSPPIAAVASSYTVGVQAKGQGSNIVFLFKFTESDLKPGLSPIQLMAATPANKENYTKCNTNAPTHDVDKVASSLTNFPKQYANKGPKYASLYTTDSRPFDDAYAEMSITDASPAVCMFRIKKGPKPG
jgi:hypothetical protein